MERWVGRVALVTGASAGIGAAICESLVEHGLVVVGCARNVAKIQQMADGLQSAKGKLYARQCDLTKEEEIASMFSWIDTTLGGVDVCVNNAGLGDVSSILDGNVQQWRNMMDVNVIALCLCTKEAVKSMQHRNVDDGQIIMINSMSGHRIPISTGNHFYCATKHAVTAITEGLRQELRTRKTNTRVAAISPGYVETEFLNVAFHGDTAAAKAIYNSMKCIQSRDIADAVVYILGTPPHVQIHDILLRPIDQTS